MSLVLPESQIVRIVLGNQTNQPTNKTNLKKPKPPNLSEQVVSVSAWDGSVLALRRVTVYERKDAREKEGEGRVPDATQGQEELGGKKKAEEERRNEFREGKKQTPVTAHFTTAVPRILHSSCQAFCRERVGPRSLEISATQLPPHSSNILHCSQGQRCPTPAGHGARAASSTLLVCSYDLQVTAQKWTCKGLSGRGCPLPYACNACIT